MRSEEAKNESILENIDTKEILIKLSHFEQATILVAKHLLYHELTVFISDFMVRKYEKVNYWSYKRMAEEDG